SRVNIVIPPISLTGPALTIRKFLKKRRMNIEDAISLGSWSEDMVEFLRACVRTKLNIIVAGNTGAGKTTVLNLVAGMIPEGERIITIENANELQLPQKYVVPLESRPSNAKGRGQITIQDLVLNSLRMRPDRVVVGEVRGPEVIDLLQAMNTGHDGIMFTIHGSGPRDALARLEMIATSSDPSVPLLNVRRKIASTVDLIVHLERLHDGSRKVI
ncbi:MAG: CpaF family protein, partial [Propionibacteriaceae bacterium]|nr:CpaF family protein [Propionibacteriaceae bacterium]